MGKVSEHDPCCITMELTISRQGLISGLGDEESFYLDARR